jgi:hypothetical protein
MTLQSSVGPLFLLQFRNLFYTGSRTPWTSNQPVARPLPTHRTTQTQNKRTHKHACPEWDSNPQSECSKPAKTVHTLVARPLWSAFKVYTFMKIHSNIILHHYLGLRNGLLPSHVKVLYIFIGYNAFYMLRPSPPSFDHSSNERIETLRRWLWRSVLWDVDRYLRCSDLILIICGEEYKSWSSSYAYSPAYCYFLHSILSSALFSNTISSRHSTVTEKQEN